jgi:hypothetical protein
MKALRSGRARPKSILTKARGLDSEHVDWRTVVAVDTRDGRRNVQENHGKVGGA